MKKWKFLTETPTKLTPENLFKILLKNRGIETKKEVDEFLNGKLEDVIPENVDIKVSQIKKTIKRINEAICKNQKIIIYGDYDVDGITGTAILWETIYSFYSNVSPYIPHRIDEGYGLSVKGIENILEQNIEVGLIITVDNGIVAFDAIEFANKKNIDVVISDHHVPSKKLPACYALVHTTKICGAGVAYLLAKEILKERKIKIKNGHLDLVALATVADLVPLTNANRILLKEGLKNLRKTTRPGLTELFREGGITPEKIGVYEIGHVIGPRLNASGRMEHAMDALRLLCTKDKKRARDLAFKLGETNRDRQLLTQETTAAASLISEELIKNEKIIFVYDKKYNQGIIGLVASRLVEKHYKPSIVVSVGEKVSKGSARSITGFNIIEYLRSFPTFLSEAGGHPMAAGFTIETEKLLEFKKAVEIEGHKKIKDELLTKTILVDLELEFGQINLALHKELQRLAPFGMANPEPSFVSRKITVRSVRTVGKDNKHLQLMLEKDGNLISSIAFGLAGEKSVAAGSEIDALYTIDNNVWNGKDRLQLKIKDIKVS